LGLQRLFPQPCGLRTAFETVGFRHFSSNGEKERGVSNRMSKKNRRKWKRTPTGIKLQALARMRLGENVSHLAKELEVNRTTLYIWRKELEKSSATADAKDREVDRLRQTVAQFGRDHRTAKAGNGFFQK